MLLVFFEVKSLAILKHATSTFSAFNISLHFHGISLQTHKPQHFFIHSVMCWTNASYVLTISLKSCIYFLLRCGPARAMVSSFLRFVDQTRHTTLGRTPVEL